MLTKFFCISAIVLLSSCSLEPVIKKTFSPDGSPAYTIKSCHPDEVRFLKTVANLCQGHGYEGLYMEHRYCFEGLIQCKR